MINYEAFMRQLDMVDVDRLPSVTIIGVGGIGTAVALNLAKMGVREFVLYDPDEVVPHNLSNQWFPNTSLGMPKVEAVAEEIRRMAPDPDGVKITTHIKRFTPKSKVETVAVVSCLDSMDERRKVWKAIKKALPALYIDTRMGGEVLKVYTFDASLGENHRRYERHLKGDGEELPCTARAIIYNLSAVSCVVCSNLKRWVMEGEAPFQVAGDTYNLTLLKIEE